MLEAYQDLSLNIDPNIFTLGSFSFTWYGAMYFLAFLTVYSLLRWRIKKGESPKEFSGNNDLLMDFILISAVGLLIGARLGYVVIYDLKYFLANPLEMILPFNLSTGEYYGISGMSYHGGIIGIILANLVFIKKQKLNFWLLADFVVPVIPAGFFWGRLGNFLNGELYGRVTDSFLGIYFARDFSGALRHPSQLYEAFFEGVLLFIVLWMCRKKVQFRGQLLLSYLMGYASIRFCLEFARQPDAHIGFVIGHLSLGQALSILMFSISLALYFYLRGRKRVIGEK